MAISLKTHKILWARSGGKCAICKNDLVIGPTDSNDDPSIVGDEAHIIARSESFTRGDYDALSPDERDHYSNLILLCKTHHKQVDDQPAAYTVEKLREIKAQHETMVRERWTSEERMQQRDELIYASYVDEWASKADLDNWRNTCSWLSADTPALPKTWYDKQKEFLTWIIGRIWPGRYPLLEAALYNYKAVLQDLLNVFDQHIDDDRDGDHIIYTEKFYKIREWNEKKYAQLAQQYDEHVNLVNDLFFELTRAANYICDRVRQSIFDGYRLKEGALLIERHNVGFELKTVRIRVEYRGDERTEVPYPGLDEFKKVRYLTRDCALDRQDPEPPIFAKGEDT
jgi:hypothetical protein